MIGRYREIFFGLLLGLAMWAADAVMHVKMPVVGREHEPAFAEELLSPDRPQLITRLLFAGFALLLGWILWRGNRRVRDARDLERRVALFHRRIINPVTLILDDCNALLRSGGLAGETLEIVEEMRKHARQIDDFAKDLRLKGDEPNQFTPSNDPPLQGNTLRIPDRHRHVE